MSPTPCALYEPGPVPDRCVRCGAPKEPHRSLPPSLAPDPFAAWRALDDGMRLSVVAGHRAIADEYDGDPIEGASMRAAAKAHRAAADALEALAAGRRP